MCAHVEVSAADERLLRAVAFLVEHVHEAKRAKHLKPKLLKLADRIHAVLPKEAA